ncbi:MotA/TolQ/ExbB proton channel family protein [Litorilituus lipolyticus]|uniref:Transporter proton channel domain containing protein n=1 Tax=Litorilituus lipolyticus TaxID=2491017 RepID=A0A502L3R2_9GAMM|nr:MotA/TolQ/ExbB proton channel family protein [Litorilituus lipolyticus]TPH18608.1 transporter proton channel domain containing protein [Litorilituus lipolyticus]
MMQALMKPLSGIFICLIVLSTQQVHANDKIVQELIERISNSKQSLTRVEQAVNKQSTALAREIAKQQKQVKALREKAVVLQRFADEQLMSVEQLEKRLTQWSTQSNYQKQLLTSYAEANQLPSEQFTQANGAIVIDVNSLTQISQQLLNKLTPSWQEQEVITEQGSIDRVNTITIGPVEVAYDASALSGGPVSREIISEPRILADIFDEQAIAELGSIQASGAGTLRFDPTLGNAYKLKDKQQGILAHVKTGGVWALPIIFFGALSLVVSVIKATQLVKLPKIDVKLIEKVKAIVHLSDKNDEVAMAHVQEQLAVLASSSQGAQKGLLDIAMSTPISQERDDLLIAYLLEYKHKTERFIGAIATSAAIAPLLGLLGTVSGMISTFMMMTIFGTGDASTVSGGISEALITTELGLIVAIPSLILSALLTRRSKSYCAKLEANAIKLSKISFA